MKYSKIEFDDVAVSIYADAAVVRGVVRSQRTSIPGKSDGDENVVVEHYTMVLANRDGSWKIVAMHSSGS